MRSWLIGSAAAMAVAGPVASRAENPSLLTLATPSFNESVLDRPVVAGSLLVGVSWQGASMLFDPATIRVDPPPSAESSTACVAVASEDGRYSSLNLFRIPAGVVAPAAIEDRSARRSVLTSYDTDRIGVVVRKAASCSDPKPGPVLPVQIGRRSSARGTLLIKLNAKFEDTSVSLIGPDGKAVSGTCSPSPAGARVAFGSECAVSLPALRAPAAYRLKVSLQETFSSQDVMYDLWLGP